MTGESAHPLCPHCGHPLQPFQLPENSGWDEQVHLACFNDDCPYFRRGWEWMFDHYGVKASYRYRVDPASGTDSPLPVWSKDAIRNRILDAEVIVEKPDDHLNSEESDKRQDATARKEKTRRGKPPAQSKNNPPRKGKRP
jgi:hypothetical protein